MVENLYLEIAGSLAHRKIGLLAIEYCKKWWELPLDARSRRIVSSYLDFLSGEVTFEQFVSTCVAPDSATPDCGMARVQGMPFFWYLNPLGLSHLRQDIAWSIACYMNRDRIAELERNATDDDRFAWGFFGYDFPEFNDTATYACRSFPETLREVVGNPFRPVAFDPRWLTSTVVGLARGIYDERAFDRMPILADALEDAGCDDAHVLAHCRGDGPHVRGCWVVDLVLGKT